MDLNSLVFALGLFSAGVWLIVMISGDFKEKKKQVQRIPNAPRRNPQVGQRVAPSAQRNTANVARRPSTPQAVSINKSPAAAEGIVAADSLQNMNAAMLRETFERFSREV